MVRASDFALISSDKVILYLGPLTNAP